MFFFFFLPLDSSVSCSNCGKKIHPETLCMGVDENVISVLLDDMVGAVNICCEFKIVSGKGCVGAIGDVSLDYTQLLSVIGCLINEVHSLKDCKVAAHWAHTDWIVSDKQPELMPDVNFSSNEQQQIAQR